MLGQGLMGRAGVCSPDSPDDTDAGVIVSRRFSFRNYWQVSAADMNGVSEFADWLLPATGPSLHLRHDIMSHRPFCGFGSAGTVPLAPRRVLLGQTPNPPCGPSTGSKLSPPPQLSELVGLGERNTRSFRGIPH